MVIIAISLQSQYPQLNIHAPQIRSLGANMSALSDTRYISKKTPYFLLQIKQFLEKKKRFESSKAPS